MQTVLVANGRSFPPSFCCVSLSHCFFPSAPSLRRGNKTFVTTGRRNKTSKGEVCENCALARVSGTSLSTSLLGPEREVKGHKR